MTSRQLRNILFGLLVAGYIYYGIQYIQKSAIVIQDQTYYVLFDDAMISMRYAYNLAHGNGLVWNAGEYVEGFTNPLWVGYMALFHLFPIPAGTISFYIQLSGLVFLALNLFFVCKIVEECTGDLFVMLSAVSLTAFYGPLNIWGLLGMEVSILTLILSAVIWLALRSFARFNPWIYILLAASTLVRIDMVVPFLIIFTVLFISQPQYRKQHLAWASVLFVLFVGGQTLARYFYYGDLLPNTYYLKVVGWPISLRIMRGLYALVWFTYYNNWAFTLFPFLLLLFRRDWKVILLFMILIGQVAYSVYVGGDAWESHGGANRYIALVMPIFFLLFAWTLQELITRAAASFGTRGEAIIGAHLAYLLIFSIALINFNLLLGDWKSIERWQFDRKPDYIAGNEHNLRIALALQATTRPGTSVAVIGAGTIPYMLPDHYAIDILGKTDPVIARGPIRPSLGIPDVAFLQPGNENRMRPGHMKWNYAHTIGELKPDVIVSLWDETKKEAAPYLQEYVLADLGDKNVVYLRKDSPNILWDQVVIK
jgi:arabinofuranosyltransferase